MSDMSIVKPRNSSNFCVIDEQSAILYSGSYTQCLIYIGAISQSHNHQMACKLANEISYQENVT